MADALVTCIVLKPHVTLMDIVSTKMLGQFGFLVSFPADVNPNSTVIRNVRFRRSM